MSYWHFHWKGLVTGQVLDVAGFLIGASTVYECVWRVVFKRLVLPSIECHSCVWMSRCQTTCQSIQLTKTKCVKQSQQAALVMRMAETTCIHPSGIPMLQVLLRRILLMAPQRRSVPKSFSPVGRHGCLCEQMCTQCGKWDWCQVWCQLGTKWCQFDPFDPSRAESNGHLF